MQRLIFLFIISIATLRSTGQSLKGTVKDRETNERLPGASIYIPDLKKGTTTDQNGEFELHGIPEGTFLVQVKLIGYTSAAKLVDFSNQKIELFELDPRSIEQQEVVITGSAFVSDKNRTSVPVTSLDRLHLQSAGASNLMEAIAQTPGVSTLSTGAGIAKPIIRGLGLSRVLVVDKGIRQEGQQWGEEHGPEIDQFSAEHIEVIKGPSSLQFGSDALGGVINIAEPITPPPGVISTMLNSTYATNNKLYGNSIMATFNHAGFIARVRGSMKSAASFSTPVETVYNSSFNEKSGELMVGLNKKWGFSHWQISHWNSDLGLTEGERDSITNQFLDVDGNSVTQSQLESRSPALPFQHVAHFKISTNNNFIIGGRQLKLTAGIQENTRQEFEDSPSAPSKDMRLKTFTGDMVFHPTIRNDWESAVGASTVLQNNINTGTSFIIPDFQSFGAGAFATAKKNLLNSTFNAGIRMDYKTMEWNTLISGSDTVFTGNRRTFQAITGAVGYTHAIDAGLSIKANLGRGFRAPTAPELASNGIHEGTFRYEIGNPDLDAETSWQFDAGSTYETDVLSISIAGFINRIADYIYYSQENNEQIIIDQHNYPVFRYKQGNALLYGGEMTVDLHPAEQLHFENSFSMVIGQNSSTSTPLPFMPPFRTTQEVRYDFKLGRDKSPGTLYLKLGMDYTFTQNRIDDDFETKTEGYLIFKVGAGASLPFRGHPIDFFITADNLTNTTYYNHLSRYKEIGVNGIGRNVVFGLQLPLTFGEFQKP